MCGRDRCTTPAARGTSDCISIALHSRRDYGWPQHCRPTLDPAIASQLQARAWALVRFEAAWRGLPAFLLERDCTNPLHGHLAVWPPPSASAERRSAFVLLKVLAYVIALGPLRTSTSHTPTPTHTHTHTDLIDCCSRHRLSFLGPHIASGYI